jgi:chromosome partitioning protein
MKSANYACMKTVVWNSQKGGSGKTSLCAHVAVEAERAGNGPVYLIDTDPQGTLSTWHEGREAETPYRVEVPLQSLSGALQSLADRGAAWCMIDTAPTRADENADLFRLADLVLVPVRPSPSDLWAVAATVKLLKQIGTPFLFVVNQATMNANITAQAVAASWTGGTDDYRQPRSLRGLDDGRARCAGVGTQGTCRRRNRYALD